MKNIYTALAAAQAELTKLVKNAQNDHFRSRYAELADVVDVVRPPLNRHGIAFFHQAVKIEGDWVMRTTLAHGESGTWLACDVPLIVDKQNMQGMKSATTYAKRIGLESVTGVAPEDDDGNAASKAAPTSTVITDAQVSQIIDLLESSGADKARFLKHFRAGSVEQIRATDYGNAVTALTKKLEQVNG